MTKKKEMNDLTDTNENTKTAAENTEVSEETAAETNAEVNEETAEVSAESALRDELEQMKDKLMRHAAEFDNYKKRTARERDELYATAVCDTIEKLLPVKDNLERAVAAAEAADENAQITDGVKMIVKQLDDVLEAIGVTPIAAVGEEFDPEKHNAVMHEENPELGENIITEELMRGYSYKEKIVRHSMVKVAN